MPVYWCPTCDMETEEPKWVYHELLDINIEHCPECGEEVTESYECPIHGTNAPDGSGGCAKC